jgi:hypothetical protein
VRRDVQFDFNWGDAGPMDNIAADFSARWKGYIVVPATDDYIFRFDADDAVRFFIDGYEIVDDWAMPAFSHQTPAISLVEGRPYSIEIDFYDNGGAANLELRWSTTSGSIKEEFVPADVFFSLDEPLPPTSVGQPDHELCIVSTTSVDDQWLAGTPVVPEIIYSADIEEIQDIQFTAADLEGTSTLGVYRILVIPIGYDSQGGIRTRASVLEDIFSDQLDMKISFLYLQKNLPIPVDKYGTILQVEDDTVLAVRDEVRSLGIPNPHLIVFDVNAAGRSLHSWVDDQEYLVLSYEGGLYTGVHELGHTFGLDDGYKGTFYSLRGLSTSTELFMADVNGEPIIHNSEWKKWIDEHDIQFVATPFTCMGQPVVQMENAKYSIMDDWWDDEYILTAQGVLDEWVFTPFQLWVMRTTLDAILKNTP